MSRYRSKSEHPKSVHRKFTGPLHPTALRDGKPTKITTAPATCMECGADLAAGDGWLLIIPRAFNQRPEFKAMCREGCRVVVH